MTRSTLPARMNSTGGVRAQAAVLALLLLTVGLPIGWVAFALANEGSPSPAYVFAGRFEGRWVVDAESRAQLSGLAQSYETIEFELTDRSKLWTEIPDQFSCPAEVIARGTVRFAEGEHPFALDTRDRPTWGPWIVYADANGITTRRLDGWGDRAFVWMDARPITPSSDRLFVTIGDDAAMQSIGYVRAD